MALLRKSDSLEIIVRVLAYMKLDSVLPNTLKIKLNTGKKNCSGELPSSVF